MEKPGFSPNICVRCPDGELFCPLHIDCCILECHACDDRSCIDHSCRDPYIDNCFKCNWMVCSRSSCESDREMLYCIEPDGDGEGGCLHRLCSSCCPSAKCPECGFRMIP
jgi:hypothetical protein